MTNILLMKKTVNHPYQLYLLLAILVSSIAACSKTELREGEQPESPVTGTRRELTLDSLYLYTKHTYLWSDVLPDYTAFNPRKYTNASSDLLNLQKELFDLASLAKRPQTDLPYEKTGLPGLLKYSYLEPGTGTHGLQAASAEGNKINALALSSAETANPATFTALTSGNTGYLRLIQFAHLDELAQPLNTVFDTFAAESVNTLIIDLRDNPGGYIETAQYLANLIAAPAMNNKVMYSQHFNSKMQQGKVTILKNQTYLDENSKPVFLNGRMATYADVDYSIAGNTYQFKKEGQLKTLQKLYFLVNGTTASASELLINVLKPYIDITLIGSQTYGKPLGSFAIKIHRYTLSTVSFQIRNAANEGDYFDGLPIDLPATEEQLGSEPAAVLNNTLALAGRQLTEMALPITNRKVSSVIRFSSGEKQLSRPEMIKTQLKLKQYPGLNTRDQQPAQLK